MRLSSCKRSRRTLTASIILVAFALRALVPAGFMLASGHPLTVIICPDGFPAHVLSQSGRGMPDVAGMPDMPGMPGIPGDGHTSPNGDHHRGNPPHSDHCLFTSGSGHGPTPAFAAPVIAIPSFREVALAPTQRVSAVRLVYVPQPRAPPLLA